MKNRTLPTLAAAAILITAACSSDAPPTVPPATATATRVSSAISTTAPSRQTSEIRSANPAPAREPTETFTVHDLKLEPKIGTVFETLLSRMPDNEITRNFTSLTDVVGVIDALGLSRLSVPDDAEQRKQYLEDLSSGRLGQGLVPRPAWPSEQWDYRSKIDWFPDLAFDFASVGAFAYSGGSFFRQQNNGPLTNYGVALGRFDPGKTATALAECKCEQPRILEYAGVEYFLWGPGDRTSVIQDRFKRPFYDHIGRGPYLFLRDGEAFYSISPGVIEQHIEVIQGTQPSLADAEGYRGAVQWLASTGIVSRVFIRDRGFTVEEVVEADLLSASAASDIQATPLLVPFDFVATGFGYDGEQVFTSHVIFHKTAASATANRQRLLQRLGRVAADSPVSGTSKKWSELIDGVEIKTAGKFLIVRIYYSNPGNAGRMVIPNTLLVHE